MSKQEAKIGVTDGPFPPSRGPRLPVDLPDDHQDVKAHKAAVRARMIEEFEEEEAKAALRRAVATSLREKFSAFTGPERDYLLARLDAAAHSDPAAKSNIRGELQNMGLL